MPGRQSERVLAAEGSARSVRESEPPSRGWIRPCHRASAKSAGSCRPLAPGVPRGHAACAGSIGMRHEHGQQDVGSLAQAWVYPPRSSWSNHRAVRTYQSFLWSCVLRELLIGLPRPGRP